MRRQRVTSAPFSRRAASLVAGLGFASIIAAFSLLIRPSESIRTGSFENDTFSRSAIGHRGLVELLRDDGFQVRISRSENAPPGFRIERELLVIAEPWLDRGVDPEALERFETLVLNSSDLLVVLPKRRGVRDDQRPSWIQKADELDTEDARHVLQQLENATGEEWPELVRVTPSDRWQSPLDLAAPSFPDSVQLLAHGTVEPLLATTAGVLIGRTRGAIVISDPDLIANHGIVDNAALVLELFDRLARGGTITFDETLHGFTVEPNFLHALGRFPLVLVPIHLLLLLTASLWMAYGRFGPSEREPHAVGAGKRYLIDNIAGLLAIGSGAQPSLRRFARNCIRRRVTESGMTGNQRHLDDAQATELLLTRAARTGRDEELRALLQSTDDRNIRGRDAVRSARRLQELTKEIIDGTE